MRPPALLLLAAAATAASGCARRDAPYRFTSPLLGSVAAASVRRTGSHSDSGPDSEHEHHHDHDHDHGLRPRTTATAVLTSARAILAQAKRARLDRRPLADAPPPEPARVSTPAAPLAHVGDVTEPADDLAVRLRAMVGSHDDTSTGVALVLAMLRHLGALLDPELGDVRDGPELVALAERRDALVLTRGAASLPPLHLGDLLVFDAVTGDDDRASLVAIAVSVDDRAVVEFVYLARGVVRRGFLCAADPSTRRDAAGRVLNTFVRHYDGHESARTRYLAGELLAATIPLDCLLRR